jgi:biotin carboxyl carrier protein
VAAGDTVLVLEAMKMQHAVAAPHDGVVAEVGVAAGQQVAAGDVLAVLEPIEEQA